MRGQGMETPVEVDEAMGFEDLPCMAVIERGGLIVRRNALARRWVGASDGMALSDLLLGAYALDDAAARVSFDCMAVRRHAGPMRVHAVAQQVMHEGVPCRWVLLMERGDELEREASLVEDLMDAMPEATALLHANRVLHVNRAFTALFGFGLQECVGKKLPELVVPEGRLHEHEMMLHTLEQNGRATMETRRRTRGGEEVDVCVMIAKVRLGREAEGMLVTYRDIRREKQEEARLLHRARHDGLTGLPNRALFLEQVSLTLARVKRRPDRRFAVIFMDLDGFKQVNDTQGHAAGDALLRVVAGRLTRCLRPQDTVARLGGDEFALLLDECGSPAEVEQVAGRIQEKIQQPIELEGVEARVAASMGIVVAVPEYESAEEMMLHADAAMYAAKGEGGARHVTYRWERTSGAVQC